ncbi:sigma factor [Micromonospora zamorensis]|uniref:sigma factor n=1 Tax=Micromonospora zamorensis TaxID=709883 RepID=UPI0037B4CE72
MTYEEFANTRLAPLLRYAVMLTGDPHQAQDLVQETMVRVQLNWRRVARADSPERYVRRMLTNQYVDWRRGSWVRRVLLRGEPDATVPVTTDHAQSAVDRDQILPVGEPTGPSRFVQADPNLAPDFLAALREDRLGGWVARHPEQVNPARRRRPAALLRCAATLNGDPGRIAAVPRRPDAGRRGTVAVGRVRRRSRWFAAGRADRRPRRRRAAGHRRRRSGRWGNR